MTVPDIADVRGVAETLLPESVLRALPENKTEAPWTCSGQALLWMCRPSRAASDALPEGVGGGARALGVVGGFVRYLDTPVGPYDEVFGAIGFRGGSRVGGHVAFMAVDSEDSLVGGRTNWAMPKTLAAFTGDPVAGTMTGASALGAPWRVLARARALGPAVPQVSSGTSVQQFGDGSVASSVLRMRGRARPALVTVSVESDGDLPRWLRPGRHIGAIVESMTFTLGVPRKNS